MVPPPSHWSSRVSHHSKRYLGIFAEDLEKVFFMGDRDIRNDPKTYNEVILDVDSERWMEAMKSKIDSIHFNKV